MQQFFVLSRSASLAFFRWGTFRDDTITGWARRELVFHAAVCLVTHRYFSLLDETKWLWLRAIDWQYFLYVICYGCKIYHYSFRGAHSFSGYHVYHPIVGRFLTIICSQNRGRDVIFHLNDKKKISAEEVTAFKIFNPIRKWKRFNQIVLKGTIRFVVKPLRGKTIIKSGLDLED